MSSRERHGRGRATQPDGAAAAESDATRAGLDAAPTRSRSPGRVGLWLRRPAARAEPERAIGDVARHDRARIARESDGELRRDDSREPVAPKPLARGWPVGPRVAGRVRLRDGRASARPRRQPLSGVGCGAVDLTWPRTVIFRDRHGPRDASYRLRRSKASPVTLTARTMFCGSRSVVFSGVSADEW